MMLIFKNSFQNVIGVLTYLQQWWFVSLEWIFTCIQSLVLALT